VSPSLTGDANEQENHHANENASDCRSGRHIYDCHLFLSTILVELFGSHEAVAKLKSLIVLPGLFILVPAIIATGASGLYISRSRRGRLIDAKKKRMPFIAANGLLILIPCAISLNRWAAAGQFDAAFYVVQTLELLAGATNLTLMGLSIRDGLTMSGRPRAVQANRAPRPLVD
jgi:hypothetical protein